jgi:carbohydrate-selective porin OprB
LIDDWSNTLSGGLESPAAFNRVLFDVTTSIQTRKLFGWEGGSAVFRVHQYAGSNGGDFVGDAQGFSNIDAQPGTKLFEAWYEQKFGEHPWRVRGGIVDANTIYATVEHASDFLDSSMGYSPTILHLPTYPDPQPGLNLMFDGERNSLALGAYRTSEDGWMALTQVARRIPLSESLETRIAGGLWHLRERLQPLTGPAEDFTTGLFLVSELAVRIPATTSRKADQTLALFVQYGHSDEDVSDVHTHIGTGLTLQGPWGRTEDAFGMGISAVQFKPTGSAHNYEASFETFYKLQIIRNLRLVADFQYIQQPGGPQNVPDCIVFTPRLVLSF